ncbi:FGGY family carbohydrate kinase [Saccharopolyspora sp. CA-218241]|uniref:FGGY family carbohydrate kinase n=1 Tax=Saccharopolyspora sp. CA-218241 TaxID=3240027 RepID=UPI003D96E386
MITIGIDAGTSVVKSVAYAEDGAELAATRRPTKVDHPLPGRAEQDMDEVWDAVATTVADLVTRLDDEVGAVAITAQGDGCWLVDGEGRPTGPAVLWNDARAADIAERWAADGVLDALFRINGSVGFAGLPHAQLRWLAAHNPDRIAASERLLSCGGWLFHQLTGRLAWDVSEASNPFLDARSGEYSDAVLAATGLEPARRLLPEVADGADRVAPLTRTAAERVGLRAGTPVVLAAYDIVSTALGAGVTEPGRACTILGTTLCTEVLGEDPLLDREPVGMSVRTPMPGRWMLATATLAGTEVVEWTCRLLGLAGPADLTGLAEQATSGSRGVLLLPYLSPGGERAPFNDPNARGGLHGLSLEHGPAEIALACLEGLALVIRDCLAAAPTEPAELRLTGGGSANRLWRQVIADVTGLPVVRTADAQAGARGAALTARALLADRSLPEVASELLSTSEAVLPSADRAAHDDAYERFVAARETARAAGWFRPAR